MKTQSPLDPYRSLIEQALANGESYKEIIKQVPFPTSERSIRRALDRWGVRRSGEPTDRPGVRVQGDEAEAVSKPAPKTGVTGFNSPEDLMAERGLSTDEWEVKSTTINEWDSPTGEIMHQLKINLARIKPITLLSPARIDGPKYKTKAYKPPPKGEPRQVVLVGDQQCPQQDQRLHELFCDFNDWYEPHEGVLLGDTIDLGDISRHPYNPEKDDPMQACLNTAYTCLRDYRESKKYTTWKKLAGNHDERIRRAQLDRLRESYNVRQAWAPDEEPSLPVLDVGFLLRLDELDIEYVRPNGDYEHEQVNLSTHLAARHGWIARKGSGASALATLEHLGYSVVVGHTHRQSLVHKTRHDIDGLLSTIVAVESGCMCVIPGGLGYAVNPDWQNGFCTAAIWPDGTFKLDLATYTDNVLYYRNERFQ